MKEGTTKKIAQPNNLLPQKEYLLYTTNTMAQYAGTGPWVFALSANLAFLVDKGGIFETLHMTSAGFGEMFEGDFADTCDENVCSSVGGWSTLSGV